MSVSKKALRTKISEEMQRIGFTWRGNIVEPPRLMDKQAIRNLYLEARRKHASENENWLKALEKRAIEYFAQGTEIEPEQIRPRIKLVQTDIEADLFKYAGLLWSVPVSAGYGRRLRFLILDEANGKLIGILGLCDPVYCLSVRDNWIGWSDNQKRQRLWHILDAYVLGAVPPYNNLLGGKLVATLATTDIVRNAFDKKYRGTKSGIMGIQRDPYLVLLTTASAMGRSSMLNRLKIGDELVWLPIGMTQGWGHFHLGNGLFEDMSEFIRKHQPDLFESYHYGEGPSWKLRVIRACLAELNLPTDLLKHGIRRQVFAAPLADHWKEFLLGTVERPAMFNRPAKYSFEHFRERWLLPRALRDNRYKTVTLESIRNQVRGL